MNIKELLEKRAALLAEARKTETTEERFEEIRKAITKLDYQIETATKQADEERKLAEKEAEERAGRLPNRDGVLFDQNKMANAEERAKQTEKIENRAKTLKDGGAAKLELRAVALSSTALGTVTSGEINPAFEQVGTLDKLVNETHLEDTGAESYKKPFVKAYGEGGITAEGAAATVAEPTFGYATINKIKITAYAEVNEEVEKLPSARYLSEIDAAIVGAWRKKVISQIINGSGATELVGIVNAPTTIIDALQTKIIATVDENTLDNIIFDYGGDEDVDGDAHIILNKLTLKAFAAVKGTDKKRAYDIVVKGNSGTINGIPFVCTSKLPAFGSVAAGKPYMLYGKLKGYELTYFTDLEVTKSSDYKFKEGVIAFKASGMVGGSPAMWNGFIKINKAAGV